MRDLNKMPCLTQDDSKKIEVLLVLKLTLLLRVSFLLRKKQHYIKDGSDRTSHGALIIVLMGEMDCDLTFCIPGELIFSLTHPPQEVITQSVTKRFAEGRG